MRGGDTNAKKQYKSGGEEIIYINIKYDIYVLVIEIGKKGEI